MSKIMKATPPLSSIYDMDCKDLAEEHELVVEKDLSGRFTLTWTIICTAYEAIETMNLQSMMCLVWRIRRTCRRS